MQFFYLYKLTNSKPTFLQIKHNSNDHRVVTMHIYLIKNKLINYDIK